MVHAYLLLVDIVAFSEKTSEAQKGSVRHLAAILKNHTLGRLLAPTDPPSPVVYFNSTGDGFVYAVSTQSDEDLPAQICDLAQVLVTQAATYADDVGQALQVRVGIHVGAVSLKVDEVFGTPLAVGTGLNWVARVAAGAAPGQALVSQEFVAFIEQARPLGAPKLTFISSPSGEPFRLRVKHDRSALVLVLSAPGLSEAVPPSFARLQEIGQHLSFALEIVGVSLVAALTAAEESVDEATSRLSPRLSLWIKEGDTLRAVRPHVALPARTRRKAPWTDARWRLPAPGQSPAGPVARAFTTQEPVWLIDLPDGDRDEAAYTARWEETGIEADDVGSFSRMPRALLVVPLVLFKEPAGVLCIDLADPLRELDGVVAALTDTIKLRSSFLLAALLHLRQNG